MKECIVALGLSLTAHVAVGQLITSADGNVIVFDASTGSDKFAISYCASSQCSPIGGGAIGIAIYSPPVGDPAAVKFKYAGVTGVNPSAAPPPNFVVVFPSSGTTSTDTGNPTGVLIGLNQRVVRRMGVGRYDLIVTFSTVDESPPSQTGVHVVLRLSRPSPPAIASVVNTATFQPAISPGALVSVFGSNLGPDAGSLEYDDTGLYPTALAEGDVNLYGSTTLKFGGIAAPLVYMSPGQINAIVPYGVGGQKAVDVVLTRYGNSTTAFTVPIQDTSPGIFTATQNGTGQGAILNGDTRYNSVDNPAAKGSAIVMFATGIGLWNPPVPDGAISLAPTSACTLSGNFQCRKPAAPVSLTIGGKPATILYAGAAPYQPWSVLQVNARVPLDVDSGPQPLVLKTGANDNSQQKVTVCVK